MLDVVMRFCDVAVLGVRYSSEPGAAEQEIIMPVNLLQSSFLGEGVSPDLTRLVVPVQP